MTKPELIENLKKLNENGIKKSKIETDLGMPNNCLSRFMSQEDGSLMADKWVEPLTAYVQEHGQPKPVEESPKMIVKKNGDLSLAPSDEKMKRLNEAVASIKKDFGEGAIMRLGDSPLENISAISTGSISLDKALGVGGLPQGRITEIYGPESSGKTTIALHVIAEAQKKGGKCAFIDAEHAFDDTYAEALGVNTDDLYLSQPDYGEQALEEMDRLILSGAYTVVVVDSVAALVPKAELEGEMGDTKMGLQARLMSQACRKITGSISKTNTICNFINQLRAVIGNAWGPSEITTGGQALKFYASVRLDVRKAATIKDGEEIMGNRVHIKVAKNKVSPPYKKAEFDLIYGEGINKMGELVDMASEPGIIKKAASWYSYGEQKLGQGRESVISILKSNEEFATEILNKLNELNA